MKIDITLQQSCSENSLADRIDRQARVALCRFQASIQTVTIRIVDTNGPKGGVDIQCTVLMKLMSTGEIVVRSTGENIFSALSHCLSRADKTISRCLDRRRNTPIRMNRRRKSIEN